VYNISRINDQIRLGILDLELFNKAENIGSKRELERKGIGFLLDKLFHNRQFKLSYTNTNKPYIEEVAEHISISHSHDKLAIIVNTNESTGVDIELLRDKVKNIQNKFLNAEELAFAQNNIETLTVLWAAKECIYKAYGLREVEFSTNISIEPWKEGQNNFLGKMDLPSFKKKYLLKFEKLDNYILVYILSEVQ
jgi:phosphopantetheinyl transferase (holo-ACP synthase)